MSCIGLRLIKFIVLVLYKSGIERGIHYTYMYDIKKISINNNVQLSYHGPSVTE